MRFIQFFQSSSTYKTQNCNIQILFRLLPFLKKNPFKIPPIIVLVKIWWNCLYFNQSNLKIVLKLQNLNHYTLKNCPRKFHAFFLLMVMYQRVQTSGRKNIIKNRSNGVVEHLLKLFVWSLCGFNRARLERCSKKCIIWAQRWRPQSFFNCYTQPHQMICHRARWIMTESRDTIWNKLGYIVSYLEAICKLY